MSASAIPFFRAGHAEPAADGLPLGMISGMLLFDTGEADHTFLFRCQDRYLTYNALAGVRSVLFVTGEEHRQHYARLRADLDARLRVISSWTGLELPSIPLPFTVPLDLETLSIHGDASMADHVRDEGIRESLARGEIVFNQASPTGARLVRELDQLLREHGITWNIDHRRVCAQGRLSLWCHDKGNYVDVVRASTAAVLPPHARTAVVNAEEILQIRRWDDLVCAYRARTGAERPDALYVKSAFDSGGNMATRVQPADAWDALAALHRDVRLHIGSHRDGSRERLQELLDDVALAPSLRHHEVDEPTLTRYLESQAARRPPVRFLVQEAIEPPHRNGDYACEGLGITCMLQDDRPEVHSSAGQLYGDKHRHHYIGSYLGDAAAVDGPLTAQVRALAAEFLARGYQGPLNFDARCDRSDRWVFIYDCNPRLSAVYPALAVKTYLSARHRVHSVVSFGYRGEFAAPDLEAMLADLSANGLLYSTRSGVGALPLPSVARDHGCDFALVNMSRAAVEAFARSPAVPPRAGTRMTLF